MRLNIMARLRPPLACSLKFTLQIVCAATSVTQSCTSHFASVYKGTNQAFCSMVVDTPRKFYSVRSRDDLLCEQRVCSALGRTEALQLSWSVTAAAYKDIPCIDHRALAHISVTQCAPLPRVPTRSIYLSFRRNVPWLSVEGSDSASSVPSAPCVCQAHT